MDQDLCQTPLLWSNQPLLFQVRVHHLKNRDPPFPICIWQIQIILYLQCKQQDQKLNEEILQKHFFETGKRIVPL